MSQQYPSRRPPESTMAAYYAETPSHRTRRPPESSMAAYHARTPPYGEHGPRLAPHPLLNHTAYTPKPEGRLPRERHLYKRKPPSTHFMAEYQTPPTSEGPLGKLSPFTLDPRMAKKGILGQKAHSR